MLDENGGDHRDVDVVATFNRVKTEIQQAVAHKED